jgi:hypothetical protein
MFHVKEKAEAEAAMTKDGFTWEWLADDQCKVIS